MRDNCHSLAKLQITVIERMPIFPWKTQEYHTENEMMAGLLMTRANYDLITLSMHTRQASWHRLNQVLEHLFL